MNIIEERFVRWGHIFVSRAIDLTSLQSIVQELGEQSYRTANVLSSRLRDHKRPETRENRNKRYFDWSYFNISTTLIYDKYIHSLDQPTAQNSKSDQCKNSNNNLPEKYFIVKNNDYVRVRYLLIYAEKSKPKRYFFAHFISIHSDSN